MLGCAGKEQLKPCASKSKAAHSSMVGKTNRRVTFAISSVQQYPADQENVPV